MSCLGSIREAVRAAAEKRERVEYGRGRDPVLAALMHLIDCPNGAAESLEDLLTGEITARPRSPRSPWGLGDGRVH